jgi:hypothetical protein
LIEIYKHLNTVENAFRILKNNFAECCCKNGGGALKLFYGKEISSGQMLNITRCQIELYDPSKDYYVIRIKL